MPGKSIEQMQHLAAGVAWYQALEHDSGRRAEQLQGIFQCRMQGSGSEMSGCNRRAQQVTIFQQEDLILGKAAFIAVVDQRKSWLIAQALSELLAGFRQGIRRTSLDANQDQPGKNAIT